MKFRLIITTTLLAFLASGCSWAPIFFEDGSWIQGTTHSDNSVTVDSGCILGGQHPDALCTPGDEGPTWPADTVVYGNSEWLYTGPSGDAWGCIYSYECFTEALANPTPMVEIGDAVAINADGEQYVIR
jgi:hypothetical protein